ncbi:MAG: 5-oxoprolinase subunit PxpB [Porticoccaceae bacterium]|nr:5-oxoprolinase subunit PxpB [Pseudomonadales bacterium]MCP5171042.1 5-oxoprolinase subunit PxpB [Pseudomonadales bacterium]MCP5301719.1 5-oxoprolinase subunit PxpB [Pseudomonadales bacterium]
MKIEVAGENALIVYLSAGGEERGDLSEFSPRTLAKIQQLARQLDQSMGPLLVDLVPSYASLLVLFDASKTDHQSVEKMVRDDFSRLSSEQDSSGKLVELPVFYGCAGGSEAGPDLGRVAARAKLTPGQVVDIHKSREYRVYAIGFAPGFAYLGELDERIATPRLETPRLQVPAGAVAIADRQTAVYPATSPGGWNLIGLCPVPMFHPEALSREGLSAMPVAVGDRVRFRAIDKAEFLHLGGTLPGSTVV